VSWLANCIAFGILFLAASLDEAFLINFEGWTPVVFEVITPGLYGVQIFIIDGSFEKYP
jgi:hypothetical protein